MDDNLLGMNSLMKAVERNDFSTIKELEKLNKRDLKDILNQQNSYGYDLLMIAVANNNNRIASYLIKNFNRFIDFNKQDNEDNTVLHIATKYSNNYIIPELFEHVNLEIPNQYGSTALITAIMNEEITLKNIKKLILYGASLEAENNLGDTVESIFEEVRHRNFSEFLEETKREFEETVYSNVIEKVPEEMINHIISYLLDGKRKKKKKILRRKL